MEKNRRKMAEVAIIVKFFLLGLIPYLLGLIPAAVIIIIRLIVWPPSYLAEDIKKSGFFYFFLGMANHCGASIFLQLIGSTGTKEFFIGRCATPKKWH